MAEYKQSFEYGETVYLLNIADTGVPIIRELKITNICRSIIMPSLVEYTAYEIGRERDNQWWFYGDEKNIFHTRAEAEQCLEYLREVFKDNPLEKMPFRIAQACMEEALGKFITLQGWGDTVTIRLSEIPIDDPQVVRLIISAEDLYKEVGKDG